MMNRKAIRRLAKALLLASTAIASCSNGGETPTASARSPHLEKRGATTQLVVNGKPWLVLGCELTNSTSSSREYMQGLWSELRESSVNTVSSVQ